MDSVFSSSVLIYCIRHISQFAHISRVRFGYLEKEGKQTGRATTCAATTG